MKIERTPGTCSRVLIGDERPAGGLPRACGAPGELITATDLPCDRNDVSECRCENHGGVDAARDRVLRDWAVQAPVSVGDNHAVTVAGCTCLNSTHSIILMRRERVGRTPETVYVTLMGPAKAQCKQVLGRHTQQLLGPTFGPGWRTRLRQIAWWAGAMPAPTAGDEITDGELEQLTGTVWESVVVRQPSPARDGDWIAHLGIGSFIHHVARGPNREGVLSAAHTQWAARLANTLDEIRELRGGTLEWGLEVPPLDAPMVVEAHPGDDSWHAYDRACAARSSRHR